MAQTGSEQAETQRGACQAAGCRDALSTASVYSHPHGSHTDRTGLYFSHSLSRRKSMKERRSCQKLSLKSGMDPSQSVKCKIVVVGDSQCGKTALLHVFAKDCFPEVRPAALQTLRQSTIMSLNPIIGDVCVRCMLYHPWIMPAF